VARVDRRRSTHAGSHARGSAAARSRARVADDTLFFTRIRTHAKWVFVFLAVTFASSFVLFGVGTGFGGLQDILQQNQGTAGGPSEGTARDRIKENPSDAQAYRDLSTALQNNGKLQESIAPLAKYVSMRAGDDDAQRELAGLYLREAEIYRGETQAASAALQEAVPGQLFQPSTTSKIGQALANDPITSAISTKYNEALNKAYAKTQENYAKAVGVYKDLAKTGAGRRDPSVQFELAQTAELAGDTTTAIAAYKRFLKLSPEDPSASAVKDRVKLLESQVSGVPGG
jgi:tetratricopeptide (TPR) repeat protein